jgi:hypothetical protein
MTSRTIQKKQINEIKKTIQGGNDELNKHTEGVKKNPNKQMETLEIKDP